MPDAIDYYFAPMSGYAYLGHARLLDIAKKYGVSIRYHPLNMLKVFAAAGSFRLRNTRTFVSITAKRIWRVGPRIWICR